MGIEILVQLLAQCEDGTDVGFPDELFQQDS